MHILVLPSWFEDLRHPTLGSFFKDQTRALAERGHQTGIIHPIAVSVRAPGYFRLPRSYEDEKTGFPILTCSYFTLPKLRQYNLQRRLRQYEKLFTRYIKQYGKPDVLHAHSAGLGPYGSAGIAARRISKKFNIPYVLTEHCSAFHTGYYQPEEVPILQDAFEHAASLLVVSESLKQDLQAFGVTRSIEILGNIIDTHVFTASDGNKELAANRPYQFIAIAYFRPIKRLDWLIEAFARVHKDNPHTCLVLVGDGEQKASLQQLCGETGVTEAVTFTGELARQQVAATLSESDCYVLTSEYETFGVVAHEALAAGINVISSACGGPQATLRTLQQRVLEDDTTKALADAMLKQSRIAETDDQRQMRQTYIEQHFSAARVGEQLEKILQQAL